MSEERIMDDIAQEWSPVKTIPESMEQGRPAPIDGDPKPIPQSQAVAVKKEFTTNEQGLMTLGTLGEQLAFAKQLIRQSMVSSSFKSPEQVVIGIQYCRALKLEPVAGLKLMYVVNGRPSLYSEGPLMLCQRSGQVADIEEFYLDKDMTRISVENKNLTAEVYAAVTRIWRRDQPLPQEDYFTLDDMERAGLDVDKKYNKPKEVWEKWRRLMLRYKARTIALRTKFADCIGGIPIAEYDDHFSPSMPDIEVPKQRNGLADKIMQEFGDAQEAKANPGP